MKHLDKFINLRKQRIYLYQINYWLKT